MILSTFCHTRPGKAGGYWLLSLVLFLRKGSHPPSPISLLLDSGVLGFHVAQEACSFLRPLKNKGLKAEIVTKIGLYDIVKSTTLESASIMASATSLNEPPENSATLHH